MGKARPIRSMRQLNSISGAHASWAIPERPTYSRAYRLEPPTRVLTIHSSEPRPVLPTRPATLTRSLAKTLVSAIPEAATTCLSVKNQDRQIQPGFKTLSSGLKLAFQIRPGASTHFSVAAPDSQTRLASPTRSSDKTPAGPTRQETTIHSSRIPREFKTRQAPITHSSGYRAVKRIQLAAAIPSLERIQGSITLRAATTPLSA